MRRKLFNITVGVSLALFLATAGMWIFSSFISTNHYIWEHLTGSTVFDELMLTPHGEIRYLRDFRIAAPEARFANGVHTGRTLRRRELLGILFLERETLSGSDANHLTRSNLIYDVFVPLKLPAILFAMLPLYWVIAAAFTQRRRHQPGHCPACGYDLRATPERCPECGKTFQSAV